MFASVRDPIVSLGAGVGHSAAVTLNGELLVWGLPFEAANIPRRRGMEKLLGRAATRWLTEFNDRFANPDSEMVPVPSQFVLPGGERTRQVACGAGVTAAVTEWDGLYLFGLNESGQCGSGDRERAVLGFPRRIGGLLVEEAIQQVSLGAQHGVAMTRDGRLATWGNASCGQLGVGTTKLRPENFLPLPLALPGDYETASVHCGANYTAALTTDGQIFVWGKRMGIDTASDGETTYKTHQFTPRQLELPTGRRAVEVACSSAHLAILLDDGSVWGCGRRVRWNDEVPEPVPFFSSPTRNPESQDNSQVWADVDPVALERDCVGVSGGAFSHFTALHMRDGSVRVLSFGGLPVTDDPLDHLIYGWAPPAEHGRVLDVHMGFRHALMTVGVEKLELPLPAAAEEWDEGEEQGHLPGSPPRQTADPVSPNP